MAAAEGGGGTAEAPGGVLEGSIGGSACVAGVAHGPATAEAARLCWRDGGVGAGRGSDGGVERAEPAAWSDAVHDAAGGMGGGVEPIVGTKGGGDRDADGEPRSCAVGRVDRVLRQHAGDASGSWGIADGRGVAGTGEGADGGSAGESG